MESLDAGKQDVGRCTSVISSHLRAENVPLNVQRSGTLASIFGSLGQAEQKAKQKNPSLPEKCDKNVMPVRGNYLILKAQF